MDGGLCLVMEAMQVSTAVQIRSDQSTGCLPMEKNINVFLGSCNTIIVTITAKHCGGEAYGGADSPWWGLAHAWVK